MKVNRVIGIVATAAATAGALALGAAPASAAYTPLNPEMVTAMQRDLGLSHEQAISRLASESSANGLAQTLQSQLGETFGGATYDAATGKLRVSTTDAAQLDQVRASGAEASLVRHSARQLDSTMDRLNGTGAAPASVTSWGVDTAANTITMTVKSGQRQDAANFIARSGIDPASVVVTESAESVRPFYNVLGGDAYYIANQARCSVGFSVRGGFVSAGHCAAIGSSLAGYNRVAMGSFSTYRFPGNDYSRANTNSNWTPVGQINNGVRVSGSQEAAIGASFCKSGSTTGWTCGTLQGKNKTVNYQEGAVYGMIQTNVHSEAGDSGGSGIAGNQGQGLLSGGNSTTTYFQPLNQALSATGSTLLTS